jgi:[ribosomal protein S5]-alanine N-acetyltransferase
MKNPWKPGQKVHIETERFCLDSMTRWEAARLTYPWTSDREILGSLGLVPRTWSRRSWYKWHKQYNNRRKFCIGIRPKNSNTLIGYESFDVSELRNALLTVVIGDRSWWGSGVVLEVRQAIIQFLFEEVGCRRIWGAPATRNFPSVFNYQALGFRSEGILRQYGINAETGAPVDHFVFAMLRDEWNEIRDKKVGSIQ